MSPQRRDLDGRIHTAHSWESLVEKQIREAMEAGAFEDLPHQGKRLPFEDDGAAGEWAMAHRMLRNAGAAPQLRGADAATASARGRCRRAPTRLEQALPRV